VQRMIYGERTGAQPGRLRSPAAFPRSHQPSRMRGGKKRRISLSGTFRVDTFRRMRQWWCGGQTARW
jgi:hypothetical protein